MLSLYAMRHPQKLGSSLNSLTLTDKLSSPSPVTPSISGIAFAVLAASLPLLRAKDAALSAGNIAINRFT